MKKILVVNINWLGDAVFSTAVFNALRQLYPQAHIACLCVMRVKAVLVHCKAIDEIIVYEDKSFWQKIAGAIGLIFKLRQSHFDLAILLHRSNWRAWMIFLAGIKQRIGFSKSRGLLTHPVEVATTITHRRDFYYQALAPIIKGELKALPTQLTVKESDRQDINALAISRGIDLDKMVVINASGNWNLKRWPVDSWRQLIRLILEATEYYVVLTGTSADRELYSMVTQGLVHQRLINLAGETTLGQSLAFYEKSSLMVCADSGPLHLADSVGARTVGLYGPTRVEYTGPCGVGESTVLFHEMACNKAPCYLLSCRDNVCMKSLTVEYVFEHIKDILKG